VANNKLTLHFVAIYKKFEKGLNSDGHVESETEEAHRRGCDEILLTSMKYEKRS
jgi:hypothetical protein